MNRKVNAAGRELVKRWEGIADGDPTTVNLDPYMDPVGIWTIGWGHAILHPGGERWLQGAKDRALARAAFPDGLTPDEAEDLLDADLAIAAHHVQRLVAYPLTDNQFGALVSFTFNLGGGALRGSTLLRLLNEGAYSAVPGQIRRWNKAKHPVTGELVPLQGLTNRRADEAKLWLAA